MSTSAETLNKWEMGQKAPLSGDILQYAQQLMAKYPRPSRNDCFALALAANLSLPLLTGDKHLRSATKREGVTVMGSLWLFVEIENHGLVTKESLTIALKKMKALSLIKIQDLVFHFQSIRALNRWNFLLKFCISTILKSEFMSFVLDSFTETVNKTIFSMNFSEELG